MMSFNIEKMNEEHVSAIARIEELCFSTPWSENSLSEEIDNPLGRFFVLVTEDKVTGYIGAHNVVGEVYITNVAVHPDYRGKGFAKALIKRLIDDNRSADGFVTLEVRESNTPARSLYSSLGFKEVGMRKNFYERPTEDAILMTYYYGEGNE